MPSPTANHRVSRRLSLIELIITLVLVSLLGALLVPFLHGILQQTNTASAETEASIDLLTVMERIAHDYDSDAELRADLALFRERILEDPSPYGTGFEVVACDYIRLEDGTEAPGGPDDILKVVIGNTNSVLIQLFPKRTE